MNIKKIVIFTRKSSDEANYSTSAQFETIKSCLMTNSITTDLISNQLSITGSAFNSKKSLDQLCNYLSKIKNAIVCVSDVSRLSRNLDFFNERIEFFNKICVKFHISNINKLFDPQIKKQLDELKTLIKVAQNESELKSKMSSSKMKEHIILIKKRNKGIPLNKIFNLKNGIIEDVPDGFYRNETTCKKRKIPENYILSEDSNKLIKKSFSYQENNKFKQNEYLDYVKILFSLLIKNGSSISMIKYYLKYLSLFPKHHRIFTNEKFFDITLIMSIKHSFIKNSLNCGINWDNKYKKYMILPYSLNCHEIDSTFSYFGIYNKINLTPWSFGAITKMNDELKNVNIEFKSIKGVETYETFLEKEVFNLNLESLNI
jgi:DNA invertase Pin-like site-specific DNA recombinase